MGLLQRGDCTAIRRGAAPHMSWARRSRCPFIASQVADTASERRQSAGDFQVHCRVWQDSHCVGVQMHVQVRELVGLLLHCTSFEQAADVVLRSALQVAQGGLSDSKFASSGAVLRAMIHLRPALLIPV